jgi:hypothetical protein
MFVDFERTQLAGCRLGQRSAQYPVRLRPKVFLREPATITSAIQIELPGQQAIYKQLCNWHGLAGTSRNRSSRAAIFLLPSLPLFSEWV